ncbi:MAG: hypothetical protein LBR38_02070 [Synergistaceae bacterium]|jgi:hypothetical protein|nr:hypothetical protein [Synergistaceae bacterium]
MADTNKREVVLDKQTRSDKAVDKAASVDKATKVIRALFRVYAAMLDVIKAAFKTVFKSLAAALVLGSLLMLMGTAYAGGDNSDTASTIKNKKIPGMTAVNASLNISLDKWKAMNQEMKDTLTREASLYALEEAVWKADHSQLGNIYWKDVSADIKAMCDGLSSGGALSFSSAMAIEKWFLQQGYWVPNSSYDFVANYKTRASGFNGYVKTALKANNTAAAGVLADQARIKQIKEADDSMSIPVLGQVLAVYNKAMEAGFQASEMAVQELSMLRLDLQRHVDAETRYAMNEQQERTDVQAAFDGAVRWSAQTPGISY